MTRKHLLLASLPILVGALVTACGDDSTSTGDTDTDTEGTTSTSTSTTTTTTSSTTETGTTTTTTTTTTTDPSTSSGSTTDETTGPPPPDEAEFIVTIENISTDTWYPTSFSPVVYTEHNLGSSPVFDTNAAASAGLAELAEDGVTATLAAELDGAMDVVQVGEYNVPETAGGTGPIAPGDSYVFNITAQQGSRLSLQSMLIESNDIFLGTGPNGVSLFTNAGFPQDERDVTQNLQFYDAGSEANQAARGGDYQGARQAAAGDGPAESGVVSLRSESTHQIPQADRLIRVDATYDMDNAQFIIVIENLDGAMATDLSAGLYALHDDTVSLFDMGAMASAVTGLESLAEDGDPTAWQADLAANGGTAVQEAVTTNAISSGGTINLTVAPVAATPLFSFATMVAESNDAFIGMTEGVALLNDQGMPRNTADIEADFTRLLRVYDAGTEVNETPGVGPNQATRQANPGDGTAEAVAIGYYDDATNDLSDILSLVDITIVNVPGGGGSHTVTITNNSTDTGFPVTLTPIPWAVHDGSVSVFTAGMPASASLEALAEDGDFAGVDGDFDTAETGGTVTEHNVNQGAMNPGPILPGDTLQFNINASDTFPVFTFVTMAVPSNDTFVSFDLNLYNGATALDDGELAAAIAGAVGVYDAGTEVNQVGAAGPDQAPRQAMANTGDNEGNGLILVANDKDPVWVYPDATDVVRVTIAPAMQ